MRRDRTGRVIDRGLSRGEGVHAARRSFHEPALFITPNEVRALPTTAAVEQAYARVIAEMPPDYARTEFTSLSVHPLGDDLAMVSGGGAWKNAANEDFMPFGMTYTLRRTGQTWRIVVAAIHAPDDGAGRSAPAYHSGQRGS